MAFASTDKFDHDGDGRPGGSKRRSGRDMGKPKANDTADNGSGGDTADNGSGGDTADNGSGGDTVAGSAGADDLGLTDAVAADDPARTGIPRDETRDSIDPAWGTLTPEAQAKRREEAEAAARA